MTERENQDLEQPKVLTGGELVADEASEPMSAEEVKRIMAQYDKGSNTREFSGVPKLIMRYLCVAFTLYMLAINTVWLLPIQVHRASFVGLIVCFTFWLYPARKKHSGRVNYLPWYDLGLSLVGLACFFYYVFNFRTIAGQMATFTQIDFIVAVIGIIVLFIACYRVLGLPLMVIVAAFIAYAYFGRWIPGIFGHAGYRVERIFTFLFYTTEGVIGTPVGVVSTFVFAFLLFGALLEKTGIGSFFIELANAISGKQVGGPAKVSVIASVFYSLLSGSSVANTVASGTFTIPMMKRMGYKTNFAGGVEAAASTGGQLMPPIMGAAAFLMADITGIPYAQIALAALIPAILYFVCIFASVHFEAKRMGLRGLPPELIPNGWRLIKQKGHLFLSIVAIVVFLMMGYTPTRAALLSILVVIVISMFRKDTRLTPKKFIDALESGAQRVVGIGVACAMAGMIVGVVVLTGLGVTFANAMLALAGGIHHDLLRLLVVLFFCMIASLILGLGVPTTAKYVIMATVTAPILIRMDVPILVAHMFVFYFGTDADITPPAGLASYAASAISGGSPIRTCVTATRLAVAAYIIPFIFVFNPQMLFIDATALDIVRIIFTGVIGIIGVASGLGGYFIRHMSVYERMLAIGGGMLLIIPNLVGNVAGVAIIVGVFLYQHMRNKSDNLATA